MYHQLIADLRAENEALDALVSGLDAGTAARRTGFFEWTIRDEIEHLHQVDGFGLAAMTSDAAFAQVLHAVRADQARGIELSAQARRDHAALDWTGLLATWRASWTKVVERLAASDPKARIRWFGPDMSLMSFAAARMMEVWAHGQDIVDLLGLDRPALPRIRHICELGVRTFAWSFHNRGLPVPARPSVDLTGPGGELWHWAGDEGQVTGSALDFALVVTQRRHVADTRLEMEGDGARQWLAIAQCFAGAPQDPPPAGTHPPG